MPQSATNEPSISLRAVLRLPALRRAAPEVVCGDGALDRPVRWVHAGEVPEMPSLLRGGELLLTTGMGLGSDPGDQQRFVAALAERGVAGLAIELGTTFAELPPALREEAATRGLPLIALHRETAFVDITEAVHREIVSHQHVLMRRGDELHARFTRLMLDGAGIPEVLAALAEALANPVVLEKAGHGLLYHATHLADDSEVLAAWEGVRRDLRSSIAAGSETPGWGGGRHHPRGSTPAGVRAHEYAGERPHLPGTPAYVEAPVPMGSGETWGRLVVLAVDSPLDEFDRVAAERAVGLIALALLRGREEDVLAARERGNLLAELLDGALEEDEAARRAASLGFDGRPRALLPIVVAHAPLPSSARREAPPGAAAGGAEATWALVLRDATTELAGSGMTTIGGLRGAEGEAMLVLSLPSPERRAEAAGRAARVLHAAVERQLATAQVAVCVGAPATSWTGLRAALAETLEAAPAALAAPTRDWHDATAPDLDRLLWSLRDSPQLRRFAERRLAPLIEHDSRRKAKLLPTLEAYLAHGCRKAETARAMHLERQSLYHRLGRIASLLDVDLEDEDVRLGLHLALRARREAGF